MDSIPSFNLPSSPENRKLLLQTYCSNGNKSSKISRRESLRQGVKHTRNNSLGKNYSLVQLPQLPLLEINSSRPLQRHSSRKDILMKRLNFKSTGNPQDESTTKLEPITAAPISSPIKFKKNVDLSDVAQNYLPVLNNRKLINVKTILATKNNNKSKSPSRADTNKAQ